MVDIFPRTHQIIVNLVYILVKTAKSVFTFTALLCYQSDCNQNFSDIKWNIQTRHTIMPALVLKEAILCSF